MPLFKVTVKQKRHSNGVPLEKGMSVQIASKYTSPFTNGGHEIIDAFQRTFGVDMKKAGGGSVMSLSPYLDVERIS